MKRQMKKMMNSRQANGGPFFKTVSKTQPFYKVKSAAETRGKPEILIYDEISWWGVSAEEVVKDLKSMDGADIDVRINSPGGSYFDGIAIYNVMKQYEGNIDVYVDGYAASAASVIALGGDRVIVGESAFFMIHEPWSGMVGSADEFRDEADLLDKVTAEAVKIYAAHSDKSVEEFKQILKKDTWINGEEALEWGFATAITKEAATTENIFDLSVYDNVPDTLLASDSCAMPDTRMLEKTLRDAGLSRTQAKALLAKGSAGIGLRDAVPGPAEYDIEEIGAIVNRVTEKLTGEGVKK